MNVEDALELAVEVLEGEGAELVEDAADLDTVVGVRVATTPGGDQEAIGSGAGVTDGRVVGEGVAEDEARRARQLVKQAGRRLVIGGVGRGQFGGQQGLSLTFGESGSAATP